MRGAAQAALLALLAVALTTALFEVALRIAGISYPSFYVVDFHTGTKPRPNAEGQLSYEGEAYVRINRQGMRDDENHTAQKPENTVRIAVLGDSYAMANQVTAEDAFWSVLERRLSDCDGLSGRQVESLNFGVSGYGTAEELLTLRHRVWDFSPDIVLLAFLTGNDVRDNSRALSGVVTRPYFRRVGDRLALDDSFRQTSAYRFRISPIGRLVYATIDRSRVLQLANRAKNVVIGRADQARARELREIAGNEFGLDANAYRPDAGAAWEEAWRVTEALLVQMRDDVREHGADFIVFTLSNAIQVDPDPGVRAAFMRALGIDDLFYPDRRIRKAGARGGFLAENLAPRMQTYAERTGEYLHGFENSGFGSGHWNEAGHRLAGDLMAESICSKLLDGSLTSRTAARTP